MNSRWTAFKKCFSSSSTTIDVSSQIYLQELIILWNTLTLQNSTSRALTLFVSVMISHLFSYVFTYYQRSLEFFLFLVLNCVLFHKHLFMNLRLDRFRLLLLRTKRMKNINKKAMEQAVAIIHAFCLCPLNKSTTSRNDVAQITSSHAIS